VQGDPNFGSLLFFCLFQKIVVDFLSELSILAFHQKTKNIMNLFVKKTKIKETRVSNDSRSYNSYELVQLRPTFVALLTGVGVFVLIYLLFQQITFTQIIMGILACCVVFFYKRRSNIKEVEDKENIKYE